MTMSSVFSAPVAVILNKRLISQRGGIISPADQSEDSLRFKLFINSNPSSVRYGLTLQVSALRDMSKENNLDQIPEHQAYIFFPTKSFFHYGCMTPDRTLTQEDEYEELGIGEKQARDVDSMIRTFRIKGDVNFNQLRHLKFCCWNASVDKISIPKLRSEGLESELKRIFGTVKTANEIDEACLDINCLLEVIDGVADKAVRAMHDAAEKDLEVRNANAHVARQKQSTPGRDQKSWLPSNSSATKKHPKTNITNEKTDNEETPKKLAPSVPVIIDRKFVSSHKTPFLRRENRQVAKPADITPKTSPNRYLHPHTFDSHIHRDSIHDYTLGTQETTLVKIIGIQQQNWRLSHDGA